MKIKIIPILGLIGTAMLVSAPARATTFDYYTEGCFGSTGCSVGTTKSYNSGDLGFSGLGSSNHPSVDANPALPATIDLGQITWDGSRESNIPFVLDVKFTAPGSNPTDVFDATLSGKAVDDGHGHLTITFSTAPQYFDGGLFELSVDSPLTITITGATDDRGDWYNCDNVTGSATLDGVITAAVPEPSTWAMMVLGFCGIGFMAYRRRDKVNFRVA
jgi:hypothetical protein